MKFSGVPFLLLSSLVSFVRARVEQGRPDHAQNDSAPLASIAISDKATAAFRKAGDAIILTIQAQKGPDSDLLEEILKNAREEGIGGNPLLLHEKLSNGKATPPGLVVAWEKVQHNMANAAQGKIPEPPPLAEPGDLEFVDDEDGDGVEDPSGHLRGRNLYVSDWWARTKCDQQFVSQGDCRCYKSITGNYRAWAYHDNVWLHVYPYRGNLKRSMQEWTGSSWNTLWSGWLDEGEVGWARAWGPKNYYAGYVTDASGDGYHYALHGLDEFGCKGIGCNICQANINFTY